MDAVGKVYIVGAGPGDPGLITVRGRACLEQADAVIYDSLVHPALLNHARSAERIFVGKRAGLHSLPQSEIQRILIEKARCCRCVVRLKGGDPFVFGRGGEEALALAEAGIPFEIVPGVTAGIAVPAYAGIPVTHRGLAGGVALLTAHGGEDTDALPVDLAQMAVDCTLVFYMGMKNLPRVVEELLRLGRPGDTPAAVIEWGACARQRTITGALTDIRERCTRAGIEAPAVIVIGAVAALRERLSWFEARPLYGLRVCVTHTPQSAGSLELHLRDLGADVFALPTLEIEELVPSETLYRPGDQDWVVLTSVNAVEMLFQMLARQRLDARALSGARICAAGAAGVLEALRRRSIEPDAVPSHFGAEAFLDAMTRVSGPLDGRRVLLPRADIARAALSESLRKHGAQVEEVVAWRSRAPNAPAEVVDELLTFSPHLIVFTNSAAVRHFADTAGLDTASRLRVASAVASLGPVTSNAARELGLTVAVEPAEPGLPHLIEAICTWWSARQPASANAAGCDSI